MQLFNRRSGTVLAVLCTYLIFIGSSHAAMIMVTTDDGGNDTMDNQCSLHEALQRAFDENGNDPDNDCAAGSAPPNDITFSSAFNITLTTTMPNIRNEVTITGPAVIDGQNLGGAVFDVAVSAGDLTLTNLTVQNAAARAILSDNSGTVTAVGVLFDNNSFSSDGGAIRANGTLNLIGSTFTRNESTNGDGGAVDFSGSVLNVDGCFFGIPLTPMTGNTAAVDGGAMNILTNDNAATLSIMGSFFNDNEANGNGAQQGGGAIWTDTGSVIAQYSIVQTEFTNNRAPNGSGGAILAALDAQLGFPTSFTLPTDLALGGIFACHFADNSAGGPTGANGSGGAIHNRGDLAVVASSFIGNESTNSAGGAISNTGSSDDVTLVNITINDNMADTDGGGIANLATSGTFQVINSTIAGNMAGNDGGGIWNDNTAMSASNTIVANNSASNSGNNCANDDVVNSGNNLQFDPAMDPVDCGTTAFTVGDPMLDPAQVNLGVHVLVETMSLQTESAAHGAGNQSVCDTLPVFNLDARNPIPIRPDPVGTSCDIGAYESDVAPANLDLTPDGGLDFMMVENGTNSTLSATLTNTGDQMATNVSLMISGGEFTLMNNACGANLAGGAMCTTDLVFSPTADGTQNETLTAMADGGLMDSINLTGTGFTPADLDLTPDAGLDFMQVQTGMSSTLTATLMNPGGQPANNVMLSISGGEYTLMNNTCGAMLGAGAMCTTDVVFAPTAAGMQNQTLSATADGGLMDTIALMGEGVNTPAALDLTPDGGLDFMTVQTGMSSTLSATLTNTGGSTAINVALMVSGGEYTLMNNTCGAMLGAGAMCSTDVVFAPTSAGMQNQTLSAMADGGLMDSIALTGEGVDAADLDLTPDGGLDFMQVQSGMSSTLSATLTNTGGMAATNVSLMISGGEYTLMNNTCGAMLGAGAMCTTDVIFAPTSAGMQNQTLSAVADSGLMDSIALTGEGIAPSDLDLTPDGGLDFMQVQTGMTSTLSATLTNTGGTTANNVMLSISGGEFTLMNNTCGASLTSGAMCTTDVVFAPTAAGMQNQSLTATADGGLIDVIALIGEGFDPSDLDLTPDAGLDFMQVQTGMTSTLSATLTNTGGTTANNVMLSISGGEFTLMNNTCGASLASGAMCTTDVVFAPTAAGMQNQTLSAMADGGLMDSIALSGEGVDPPAIDLTPDAGLDFMMVATGGSSTLSATLTNTGGSPANNVMLSISGGEFTLMNNTCAGSLAAGAMCTSDVVFAPTSAGIQNQTLNAMADGGLMDSIALSGEGFDPSDLDLTPDAGLDFMQVQTGMTSTLSATLTNTGGVTANNVMLSISGGEFTLMNNTCGASLGAGAMCTTDVVFAPTAAGVQNQNLMATADGGLMDAISLTGEGINPGAIALTPMMGLDFGQVPVTTQSAIMNAMVENTGQVPLTNLAFSFTGDFIRDGGSCGTTLNAGATCTVGVRFVPLLVGAQLGSLAANADGGLMATIQLSGEGTVVGGGPVFAIPTLGNSALILLALVISLLAVLTLRRRKLR